MRHVVPVPVVLLLVAACSGPPPDAADRPADPEVGAMSAEDAVETISAAGLETVVAALASDEMEGRGPGSASDERARSYLAEGMEALGLAPGGSGGSWFQPFEMVGLTTSAPPEWSFAGAAGTRRFAFWEEYIASTGVQAPDAVIEDAEVVFVGYGIEAPEYGWDDWKDVDVAGRVVLVLNNDPDWDPELFEGDRRLYYGRWTYKYEQAARKGAAGAIIVHTEASAGYPFSVVQSSWTGEQFELPAGDEPRVQVAAWLSETASRELVGLAGRDLDELVSAARSPMFRPVPLGIRTSIELTNAVRRVETGNVLGLLRGRDPELAQEVVVYTAHHDHLGIGHPDETGDAIYNGARDNASGTAMVLEIARAFTALPEPPRRSVLFAFVGAEEQGLLGSKWYAAHPTFPPGRLAAVLNFDSGNIWGRTRDVTFVGIGKSDLGAIVVDLAAEQGRTVVPDQFPDKGYYYRSDQFSLAKIGVPGIYLRTGTEFEGRPEGWGRETIDAYYQTSYHQPSDELDEGWDFGGMVQDAGLGFRAGLAIAERDELPAWTPGDEFEAARLAALAALEP